MPAIIEVNGKPILLFSYSHQGTKWRSYYAPLEDLTATQRINTTTPQRGSECSPDGYTDSAGQVHLSITQDYRLRRYCGPSLDSLMLVQDYGACLAGTVLPNGEHVLYSQVNRSVVLRDDAGHILQEMPLLRLGFDVHTSVTRITFMCEDPDKIIVTGASHRMDVRSAIFSLSTGRAWEITVQGRPAYKCTIYRGALLHAVKGGPIFEDRYLARTTAFELTPV